MVEEGIAEGTESGDSIGRLRRSDPAVGRVKAVEGDGDPRLHTERRNDTAHKVDG